MSPDQFRAQHPDLFYLTADQTAPLQEYLERVQVLEPGEEVTSAGPAGEGNMNVTVRVQLAVGGTPSRSLIVKQSRPWVEKYPSIEAPWDRVLGEARFYLLTASQQGVAARLPKLIEVDPDSRVMVIEDLGQASDYTSIYRGERLDPTDAAILADWLSELHATDFPEKTLSSLANQSMRRLNHEHIFLYPLKADNGLDLDAITPGLRELADGMAREQEYNDAVSVLGELYLSNGTSLLHGDFFPGSWLRTERGPAIIDPEFAFFGPTEFDLGVLLAHLYLANQPEAIHGALIENYRPAKGFDWRLALAYCGVEIMRRLIGVAQLPLSLDREQKAGLLRLSHNLVVSDRPLQSEGLRAADLLRRHDRLTGRSEADPRRLV